MTAATRVWARAAELTDAPAIREVAVAAWWATYGDRLLPDTIERFLAAAYSEERVARRIERHEVLVAGVTGVAGTRTASGTGGFGAGPTAVRVDAFAEVAAHEDHLQLVAIYARPELRGHGLGSALLAAIVASHPDDALAADVLLDNELAEPFYASRGFVPGELLTDEIAGEPIRERRWWRRAGAETQR